MNNSIGYKIKRLREEKNISQEELAFELDTSQSNLSKIENGTIEKVDFFFMQKICDYFKVEPQYFLDDQIVQNNTDNNNNSAVGNIYSTVTIHNNVSEDILSNLAQNQGQITKLIEMQNKLIERLLKKGE